MQESVKSLKGYFLIVAVLTALGNVGMLLHSYNNSYLIQALIGMGFAASYFYFGLRLQDLLPTRLPMITGVLIAGVVWFLVLVAFFNGSPLALILRFLVTGYLIINLRRLATPVN